MRRRGRTIAFSTVALGLAVLVVAGIAAKGWIRELLLIHKLEAKDEEIVSRAVEELGEMGSGKAVPYIFRRLKQDPVGRQLLAKCAEAIVKMGNVAVPYLIRELENGECRLLSVVLLGAMGPSAKEATRTLQSTLADEDDQIRQAAADALRKING